MIQKRSLPVTFEDSSLIRNLKFRGGIRASALLLSLNLFSMGANATCDVMGPAPGDIGIGGGGSSTVQLPCGLVGNPISIFSGNKVQLETDWAASTAGGLTLSRIYNSLDGLWRHNYSDKLMIGSNIVAYLRSDGSRSLFLKSSLAPIYGSEGKLTRADDTWQYEAPNGETLEFNSSGRMISRHTIDGTVEKLTYEKNRILITNLRGQRLYLQEGMLQQLIGAQLENIQWSYTYTPDTEQLIKVTRTIGTEATDRIYHYEVSTATQLLTGITNEAGVRFATWHYDEKYRARLSEHSGGADRTTIEYLNPTTTAVTSALGSRTVYTFKEINYKPRITRIIGEPTPDCPASDSQFEYDHQGRLIRQIKKNGSKTEYSYNERNLVTRQVDAASTPQAQETLIEWHPYLPKPTKITRPTSVTRYTYDKDGREIQKSVSHS